MMKKLDPQILHPLNVPRPLRVRTGNGGRPLFLHLKGGVQKVQQILEVWQVDEEWWRNPISRRYAKLVLEDGRMVTVYRDLLSRRWYLQKE
ncbi:MAG: hypothetical protein HKO65_10415 [Gemmatimonadetes bacterium]|nr:hypothetical protein [Gemmatimonadota bacterium]NNM05506.1 hypothetical protein [Gemmatimonadota bacterium]